jgi:hypothetical protein
VLVAVAGTSQPFLQDSLILLFDFGEHHAHAVSAHAHDLTKSRENGPAMNDAKANFGIGGERFLRGDFAAEDTEVCGLFASFGFRFHVDEVDGGGEAITAGSGSLDQIVFSTRFGVPDRFSYNGVYGAHGTTMWRKYCVQCGTRT